MSWILIANRTGARIVDKQGRDLSLVQELEHSRGRLRDREVDSDRQGRSSARVGSARHALSPAESPHEHDARAFARVLADALRQGRLGGHYERLILVAEPRFLGLVRQALDDVTARLVSATVPKDLAQMELRELAAHLPELPQPVL
jgi:protein required for attachment to host cells